MSHAITAGMPAPNFTMPRDGGEDVSLTACSGSWLVLYFYPKDDTPGCTKEAIEFTALTTEFAAANATIIGVSKDPVAKHEKFKTKHSLDIILAADEPGDVVQSYGVWVEKNMYGKKYMGIERATFLIDPQGVVRHVWRKVKPAGHAKAVLETLQELSATP